MWCQKAFFRVEIWLVLGVMVVVGGCGGESTSGLEVVASDDGGEETGARAATSTEGGGGGADAGTGNSNVDASTARTDAGTGADTGTSTVASADAGNASQRDAATGQTVDATSTPDARARMTVDATTMDAPALGADAMGCSRASCPMGCCDANGRCQPGITPVACGVQGEACQDCMATGFEGCNTAMRTCFTAMTPCGPGTCAGCCAGGMCLPGGDPNNCGVGGQACQSCTANGLVCTAQQCVMAPCGPANCAGCCSGSQCLPGDAGGAACGPGVQPCNDTTCPNGCCDANGVCQSGTSDTACGSGASLCQSCANIGFGGGGRRGGPFPFGQFVCTDQVCQPPPACACTTGCCDTNGACQPGASNTACGQFGYCQDCTQSASQCSNQQCGAALDAGVCNAQTCPAGCCDQYGECQQGIAGTVCGNSGTNCQSCVQNNQVCSNQQCSSPPDGGLGCGPNNCGGCCDGFGNCNPGNVDAQCGLGGRSCMDCSQIGGTCSTFGFPFGPGPIFPPIGPPGTCALPDGAVPCSETCEGCCDATGTCQPGFTNAQCGELGATCLDCATGSPPSTCDLTVYPRTCTSLQSQCPAPYPSCPAALTEKAPARQKVCSTSELENAAAACAGGAATSACGSFMNFENSSNLSCYNCLEEFDYDFVTQVGTRLCVAPYVDATCNHNSACVADCVTQSCYECADSSSTTECDTQAQSGTCSAYFQGDQCVTTALAGAGALCNPTTYGGNFGAWLQAVGAQYCGM